MVSSMFIGLYLLIAEGHETSECFALIKYSGGPSYSYLHCNKVARVSKLRAVCVYMHRLEAQQPRMFSREGSVHACRAIAVACPSGWLTSSVDASGKGLASPATFYVFHAAMEAFPVPVWADCLQTIAAQSFCGVAEALKMGASVFEAQAEHVSLASSSPNIKSTHNRM